MLQTHFPLQVYGSESLVFPASSCALTVTGRAFEAFPYIARPTEASPTAHGDSPTSSGGLPLVNPARKDVAIFA